MLFTYNARVLFIYYTRVLFTYYTRILFTYYTRVLFTYYTRVLFTYNARVLFTYYTRVLFTYYTRVLFTYYTHVLFTYYTRVLSYSQDVSQGRYYNLITFRLSNSNGLEPIFQCITVLCSRKCSWEQYTCKYMYVYVYCRWGSLILYSWQVSEQNGLTKFCIEPIRFNFWGMSSISMTKMQCYSSVLWTGPSMRPFIYIYIYMYISSNVCKTIYIYCTLFAYVLFQVELLSSWGKLTTTMPSQSVVQRCLRLTKSQRLEKGGSINYCVCLCVSQCILI